MIEDVQWQMNDLGSILRMFALVKDMQDFLIYEQMHPTKCLIVPTHYTNRFDFQRNKSSNPIHTSVLDSSDEIYGLFLYYLMQPKTLNQD
jgi:hypothetical protein